MTGAIAILKKDLGSFCHSWVGVLVMFSFLLISGIFFTLFLLGYSQISLEAAQQAYKGIEELSLTGFVMGTFILNASVLFLFLAPLLSMRSLAEEKRIGTLELLYTYPLSDMEIVLGKYLALVMKLVILFLPTLFYLAVIHFLGAKIDWGIIAAGSLGFILLGSSFLAIGLFFSSVTENQIIAAGLAFSFLVAIWIFEWLFNLIPGPWGEWFSSISLFVHFRDFPLGIIDLKDVLFFICTILLFSFLTLRTVEMRNWKG